jgi:hypothetical protein
VEGRKGLDELRALQRLTDLAPGGAGAVPNTRFGNTPPTADAIDTAGGNGSAFGGLTNALVGGSGGASGGSSVTGDAGAGGNGGPGAGGGGGGGAKNATGTPVKAATVATAW